MMGADATDVAKSTSVEVLVVGGGPVGLALAIDLGQRGVSCILLEQNESASILPKMELCNSRTMEIFHRLGIAERVRQAGWPMDTPMDVVVGPSLVDAPYAVLKYASVAEQQFEIRNAKGLGSPREAYHRISQYSLEPLLREIASTIPGVDIRFGHEFVELNQTDSKVAATVRRLDGSQLMVDAKYLVGCDGGRSTVRKAIGVELEGQAKLGRSLLIFFRAPRLLELSGMQPARHYYLAGKRHSTLVTQDDLKRWALHVSIGPDVDISTIDPHKEIEACLGLNPSAEILYFDAWSPNLLVATKYRRGRVFLAGDAAHQYIPTGGFGMNTGIGDADNLGWKLAATLQGWAGDETLNSYEEERLPLGRRNREASGFAAQGNAMWRTAHSDFVASLNSAAPGYDAFLETISMGQRRSHEMRGIELGYAYRNSPIVETGSEEFSDERFTYEPIAIAGCRLPHRWLDPVTSVHDLVGASLTLLMFGESVTLAEQFKAFGNDLRIPIEFRIVDRSLAEEYGANALLVRPDLHIGWSQPLGASSPGPEQVKRILQRVSGYQSEAGTEVEKTGHSAAKEGSSPVPTSAFNS